MSRLKLLSSDFQSNSLLPKKTRSWSVKNLEKCLKNPLQEEEKTSLRLWRNEGVKQKKRSEETIKSYMEISGNLKLA
jgi:hypothetical protein